MEPKYAEPLAVTLATCCAMTSLSRSTAYVLMAEKKLQKVKVRGRTLITMASIKALLADAEISDAQDCRL